MGDNGYNRNKGQSRNGQVLAGGTTRKQWGTCDEKGTRMVRDCPRRRAGMVFPHVARFGRLLRAALPTPLPTFGLLPPPVFSRFLRLLPVAPVHPDSLLV